MAQQHEFNDTKRLIYTYATLTFWITSLILRQYKDDIPYIGELNTEFIALGMQLVGLVTLIITMRYSKCPSCAKLAGGGILNLKKCKACGHALSE